jgi:ferredoxin-fold anticodon binding domain-containing protein
MNIWAGKGDTVAFVNSRAIDDDIILSKLLTLHEVYEIEQVDVYGYHTDVFLTKFPGVSFPCVIFEDVNIDDEKVLARQTIWNK